LLVQFDIITTYVVVRYAVVNF